MGEMSGERQFLETFQRMVETKDIPARVSNALVIAGVIMTLDEAKEARREAKEAKEAARKRNSEIVAHRIVLTALVVAVGSAYGLSLWDWAKMMTSLFGR